MLVDECVIIRVPRLLAQISDYPLLRYGLCVPDDEPVYTNLVIADFWAGRPDLAGTRYGNGLPIVHGAGHWKLYFKGLNPSHRTGMIGASMGVAMGHRGGSGGSSLAGHAAVDLAHCAHGHLLEESGLLKDSEVL